jgi:hypothetical protein
MSVVHAAARALLLPQFQKQKKAPEISGAFRLKE